jgi:5-(carboxyamino)imidazole ribonucleotide mutase
MPELRSQQLVPPPETGGQVSWQSKSEEQLLHVMPPLLLPLEPPLLEPLLLPLEPPLLEPLLLPLELPLLEPLLLPLEPPLLEPLLPPLELPLLEPLLPPLDPPLLDPLLPPLDDPLLPPEPPPLPPPELSSPKCVVASLGAPPSSEMKTTFEPLQATSVASASAILIRLAPILHLPCEARTLAPGRGGALYERMTQPLVSILMGSKSDLDVMQPARDALAELGVAHEVRVLSAHRTPDALFAYLKDAEARGIEVFIAGAGGAAHLPGVVAAKTTRPVLGVPIPSGHLLGLDALLAIVQMPKGIPVATFAVGKAGAGNAGLFAVAVLASKRPELASKLLAWREAQAEKLLKESVIV